MTTAAATNPIFRFFHDNRGMLFPLACISLLFVLLVPLPPGVLDLLLVLNLTLSVLVLVTTIYVKSALEFAVFPSLLLAITLFRLVLNVATTRLILTADGDPSAAQHAAGEVVLAFSNFVAADALAVGAVIFLIIFIIQFVVITKGCSRISEVAARFVLDAMPGKQMGIDADLNAGVITDVQASQRREDISRQADFYGAMDGASKFVRGDAIAAVVITIINILGGLFIGMVQRGWSAKDSLELFTKLTIGDGLVSQVPAFIVSLGAGLIVTRSSMPSDLGNQVLGEMFARPRPLIVAAIFLALLSLTGLPRFPLLAMAGACAALAWFVHQRQSHAAMQSAQVVEAKPEPVEKSLDLDALEVEIGPGLRKLGGDLMLRIDDLRRTIARDLGFIVPPVRVHENRAFSANDYIIHMRGHALARGVAYPDQFLAITTGGESAVTMPDAEASNDPITGAAAWWITESQLLSAQSLGLDVVPAADLLINHLDEVIRAHAHELLTRQEVKNLLDNLKERAPALVDEVIPAQIKPGELHRVLQNLLRERVSIRDLELILENLADHAPITKDVDLLTEHVRGALARTICRQYVDEENRLSCLTLTPELEGMIGRNASPALVQRVIEQLKTQTGERPDCDAVVLCSPNIRPAVRRIMESSLPRLGVLAFTEVAPDVAVEAIGCVAVEV